MTGADPALDPSLADDPHEEPVDAPMPSWRDRVHTAGAVLLVVASLDVLAVTLYDVAFLRANGGTGSIGQISISGLYSLLLLVGVLFLNMPSPMPGMQAPSRRAFFALGVAAAGYVAVTQLIEVYAVMAQPGALHPATSTERGLLVFSPLGDLALTLVAGWLAVLGFLSASDPRRRVSSGLLTGAAILGVMVATFVQVAAAGTGATSQPNVVPAPSTQVPLPVG